jgi:HK97 family phage portal protein
MAKAIFLGNEVKNLSLTDPQAWADVLGWEVNKGDLTAPLAASAVGWVYRCIHIRAGAVASLPWAIYRGDEKIIDQDETSLALPWADDLGTMLYLTESALCIYGYAYWRKVINRGRSISELRWWSPETTTPVWDAALGLVAFDRRVNNRLARYPKDEIVYFRIPSAAHETEPGTSPVAAALDDAGILYNVNQFASSFFKRGAIKATLLTVEGDPLQSERERLKSWWRRAFEGIGNAWSTEVISAAVKPVIIGEGIAELGNTELTQERREGISTAMGVPHSLVMSNAANFATAQSDTQGFYDWTIRPQARILANVLNRQLFAPLGLQFRFDIESLSIYQEDEEQRSGALLNLVNAGVPLPLAMEILGVDLPGTLTYEELQSQLAPVEVAPIPAPALPPPPPPVEDGKAIDLKRFRSWAAKRKQPDPDDFKSDHLSRWEKAAILAELREDADGGTMSPFPLVALKQSAEGAKVR